MGIRVLFFLLFAEFAFAQSGTLNQVQLYQRCFNHITGTSALTSPHLKKIRSGEMKAIDACIQHLEQASLAGNGRLSSSDPVSFQVLQQIYQVHRSWFDKTSVLDSEVNSEIHWSTVDVYDPNEPALHLTRAALSQSPVHIAEALTRPTSLEAVRAPARQQVRYIETPTGSGNWSPQVLTLPRVSVLFTGDAKYDTSIVNFQSSLSPSTYIQLPAPLVQVGQLHGIQDRRLDIPMQGLVINPNSPGLEQLNPGNPQHNFPIYKNHGGGIIGSMPYLINNFGHGYVFQANGAEKLNRKWSESIMKDFFCRDIPVLREEDVIEYQSTNAASPQFRKGVNCLTCHSTIDQMALTARNLKLVTSGNGPNAADYVPKYFATIAAFTPTQAAQSPLWPEVNQNQFHLQNPQGMLYFRNYTGRLVKRNLSSIQELGTAIAEQDDYYVCLAKRYFEYFTGVDVQIRDPALRNDSFYSNPRYRELRDYVVDLGLDLRSHGQVKRLMTRILKSPYYTETSHLGGN